jgi:hypothetical protein
VAAVDAPGWQDVDFGTCPTSTTSRNTTPSSSSVLTAEATYLCNHLEIDQAHQPSYPLVHLKMEDVWVWDKNRPSRIIPRTEVHTSQDVTVEELKSGDIDTTLPIGFELTDE